MCVCLVSLWWFKVSEAHCVCGTICKLMAQDTYNTLNSVSKVQVVFGQPVSFVRVLCCVVVSLPWCHNLVV